MPADLSPPGTRHAAGSASRKCHARSDCQDGSDPSEDASFGAGEILVSGSGSQGGNWTPGRGWAAGRLESSGDQRRRPKSRARSRFGEPTKAATVNFVDRVRVMPGLSYLEIAALERRIRALQERVGYTGDYDSWIASVTPAVAAGQVNFAEEPTHQSLTSSAVFDCAACR